VPEVPPHPEPGGQRRIYSQAGDRPAFCDRLKGLKIFSLQWVESEQLLAYG
jgi:hypothetical protein